MTFDADALDRRIREGITRPGLDGADPDWWSRWRQHLAARSAPAWFYEASTAPAFFRDRWPALTQRWIAAADGQLNDLVTHPRPLMSDGEERVEHFFNEVVILL